MDWDPYAQLFLRDHLRCLFLDPLTHDSDKLPWLDYTSRNTSFHGLAKLILLLYSPSNTEGNPQDNPLIIH